VFCEVTTVAFAPAGASLTGLTVIVTFCTVELPAASCIVTPITTLPFLLIAPAPRVTVVVLPFAENPKPVPSPGFLRTVCRHLDRHRLITTEIEVVGPLYIEVTVTATLRLLPGFSTVAVEADARAALDRFFDPLIGGPAVVGAGGGRGGALQGGGLGEGWPFGRTVHVSEVYEVLEAVPGVDCAAGVSLLGTGPGAGRDEQGGITLPPTGLVCAGEHRLTVLAPAGRCPVRTCPDPGCPPEPTTVGGGWS